MTTITPLFKVKNKTNNWTGRAYKVEGGKTLVEWTRYADGSMIGKYSPVVEWVQSNRLIKL